MLLKNILCTQSLTKGHENYPKRNITFNELPQAVYNSAVKIS